MLAALLLTLGESPTPPPVVIAQQFIGGGPFWKRYGYDPRYYKQDEEEIELSQPQEEVIQAAVEQAVVAIRVQDKPAVLDAKRIYEQVFQEVRGIERERVREIWRAEVKRRLRELEDEDMQVILLCLT